MEIQLETLVDLNPVACRWPTIPNGILINSEYIVVSGLDSTLMLKWDVLFTRTVGWSFLSWYCRGEMHM